MEEEKELAVLLFVYYGLGALPGARLRNVSRFLFLPYPVQCPQFLCKVVVVFLHGDVVVGALV